MAYLTFSDLNSRTFTRAGVLNESIAVKRSWDKTVFLSYRHQDRQWVDPIVRLLKGLGVAVYIDYLDQTLEEQTNDQVAQTLRKRISGSSKFIAMATPNSGQSRWMPWELGLGDRIINYGNVAILPLTENASTWHDQENGKIYGRIEKTNFGNGTNWSVLFPDNKRVDLKIWLSS